MQSVITQTYTNWELVVVDDHSTDNSYDLISGLAKKEKRIKLFKNKETGIIPALRLAYVNSQGTLITRMDSDDVMVPQKLTVMAQSLSLHGKGKIALGLVKYFSQKPLGRGYLEYELWLNKLTASGTNFKEIYKECVIPSPCWMVHRSDLDQCGAFDSDAYPEDYDLTFRFYVHGLQPIPSNEVLHYWRDYATRTSRTHVHYADNTFIQLKVHYFLQLDYNANRPLVVWGAGKKGKLLAKVLMNSQIPFHWVCNNPYKIGKEIYGKILLSVEQSAQIENAQTLVMVSNKVAKKEIADFFKLKGGQFSLDYFFFV